jgi:hypothetical protein
MLVMQNELIVNRLEPLRSFLPHNDRLNHFERELMGVPGRIQGPIAWTGVLKLNLTISKKYPMVLSISPQSIRKTNDHHRLVTDRPSSKFDFTSLKRVILPSLIRDLSTVLHRSEAKAAVPCRKGRCAGLQFPSPLCPFPSK